jgi:hypothetical protein
MATIFVNTNNNNTNQNFFFFFFSMYYVANLEPGILHKFSYLILMKTLWNR